MDVWKLELGSLSDEQPRYTLESIYIYTLMPDSNKLEPLGRAAFLRKSDLNISPIDRFTRGPQKFSGPGITLNWSSRLVFFKQNLGDIYDGKYPWEMGYAKNHRDWRYYTKFWVGAPGLNNPIKDTH